VETIGDAYMIVSGNDDAPNHAARMLCLATEMLEVSRCIRLPRASVRTLAACSHLALPTLESRASMDTEEEWGGGASHIRRRYRRREPAEINRTTSDCAIEQTRVKETDTKLCGDEPTDAALST
jgi:hypothetical protein